VEQVVIYGTQGDDIGKFIGFVATGDGAAQRAGWVIGKVRLALVEGGFNPERLAIARRAPSASISA
jgi:hypothetical protein